MTVNARATAPTSASASVNPTCGGATTLSVSGGSAGTGGTLKWYSGSCGGTAVGTGNNLSVSPTATTTYYARYETAAPCSDATACAVGDGDGEYAGDGSDFGLGFGEPDLRRGDDALGQRRQCRNWRDA